MKQSAPIQSNATRKTCLSQMTSMSFLCIRTSRHNEMKLIYVSGQKVVIYSTETVIIELVTTIQTISIVSTVQENR